MFLPQNEYSRQIREYRQLEKPGKALGKVFVKGKSRSSYPAFSSDYCARQSSVFVESMSPYRLSRQPSRLPSTMASTAWQRRQLGLERIAGLIKNLSCRSLPTPLHFRRLTCYPSIEHSQLEFTLTVNIRKDPHITALIQAASRPRTHVTPEPPPTPAPLPAPKSGGLFRLFATQGKKSAIHKRSATQPDDSTLPLNPDSRTLEEGLGKYLKSDGSLAQAFISFKDVAKRCDARLFETSYPLFCQTNTDGRGSRAKASGSIGSKQLGEIILQVFRLPPLPGVPSTDLPQSLEECHKGLRHVAWHKVTYYEGTLTQNGGGCSVRRLEVAADS